MAHQSRLSLVRPDKEDDRRSGSSSTKSALRSLEARALVFLVALDDVAEAPRARPVRLALEVPVDPVASDPDAALVLERLQVALDHVAGGAEKASTSPSPTTVRQPVEEMSREMTKLLLERIAGGGERESLVVPTELVVRVSA
jgi:Periplasmic binding protein-like domain